jgi:hypothetical protein
MAKKAKQSVRSVKAKTPAGYTVLDRAPNWDHDNHPVIEGVRRADEEIPVDKGRATERLQRCMEVIDKTIGAVTIWESAMLRNLFDRTKDGDTVRVEFLGYGTPRSADEQPPKKFTCAVMDKGAARKNVNPF